MKTGKAELRRRRNRTALLLAGCGVAVILLLASATSWLTGQGAGRSRGIGGPFTLMADTGRVVTERSFPGKYLAIYFGYTHCQDVCPATLTTLSAALGRVGQAAEHIQPLFITVDPKRDTPAVLRSFVAGFAPNLRGLTGSTAELARVGDAFHVVSLSHADPAQHEDYRVDHSSVIYLMAPDGRFVAPIPADASEMVMAEAMARYLKAS